MTKDFDLYDATATYDRLERSTAFVLRTLCWALSKGHTGATRAMLAERGVRPPHLDIIDKADVAAMTTGSGLNELRPLAAGFLALVNQLSAFGRVPFTPAPFNTRFAIEGAGAALAAWVAEGRAIPLSPFDATGAVLRPGKLGMIAPPIPVELARSSDPPAVALILRMLTRWVALSVDPAAFDPVSAGSLTFGATEIPGTGNFSDDVAALLAAISDGTPSRPYVVLGMTAARTLAFSGEPFADVRLVGTGSIAGVPQVTSASPALTNLAVAIDADGVAVADGGIELDQAESAALEMSDAPLHASADSSSPPVPVSTTVVSMFQTNSVALRALRYLAWAKRDDAVAFLSVSVGSPT